MEVCIPDAIAVPIIAHMFNDAVATLFVIEVKIYQYNIDNNCEVLCNINDTQCILFSIYMQLCTVTTQRHELRYLLYWHKFC